MSWVKLDDGCPEHAKQLAAGPLACWLWVCGLAYCNRQKSRSGFIPAAKVPVLYPMPSPMRQAGRLVDAGLWQAVDGGFRVHDYHDFQPSDALRQKRAAAGRLGGVANAKQMLSKEEANGEANCFNLLKQRVGYGNGSSSSALKDSEEHGTDSARARANGPDAFDAFWSVYPRKVAKAAAERAWRKLAPDESTLEAMQAALAWQVPLWRRAEARFVPYPATYLNGRRWLDERPDAASAVFSPRTASNAQALAGFVARRAGGA